MTDGLALEQGSNQSIGEIVASKREEAGSGYGQDAPPYGDRPESPRSRLYEQQSQYGGSVNALTQRHFGSHGSLFDAGRGSQQYLGSGSQVGYGEYLPGPPSTSFSASPRGASPSRGLGLPDDAQIISDVQMSELSDGDAEFACGRGYSDQLAHLFLSSVRGRSDDFDQEASAAGA